MQRAEKAVKPATDSPQRQPAAGRTAAPEAASTVSDQRPDAIAQREQVQMIAQSPRVEARRASGESLHNSPRMVEQRQQLRGIFGGAVQRQGGLEDEEPLQGQRLTAQRQTAEEEEEPLQGRFETAQRQGLEEDDLQMKVAPVTPVQREAESPPPPNRTGLPDGLKSGIESLSGMAMDHVRVHYNSAQPAQLNALAYAQGSDIHLAPGQEQHLPHEAWHVVQQAQGRVRPTLQLQGGVPVNDNEGLEREADVMGAKASGMGRPTGPARLREDRTERGAPHPPQAPLEGAGTPGTSKFLFSVAADNAGIQRKKTVNPGPEALLSKRAEIIDGHHYSEASHGDENDAAANMWSTILATYEADLARGRGLWESLLEELAHPTSSDEKESKDTADYEKFVTNYVSNVEEVAKGVYRVLTVGWNPAAGDPKPDPPEYKPQANYTNVFNFNDNKIVAEQNNARTDQARIQNIGLFSNEIIRQQRRLAAVAHHKVDPEQAAQDFDASLSEVVREEVENYLTRQTVYFAYGKDEDWGEPDKKFDQSTEEFLAILGTENVMAIPRYLQEGRHRRTISGILVKGPHDLVITIVDAD